LPAVLDSQIPFKSSEENAFLISLDVLSQLNKFHVEQSCGISPGMSFKSSAQPVSSANHRDLGAVICTVCGSLYLALLNPGAKRRVVLL
jgi:hypothetical protein